MPSLFWLSLLLGYVVGIAAAVLLLPGPIVQPLYGKLAAASVVVVGGITAFMILGRARAAPVTVAEPAPLAVPAAPPPARAPVVERPAAAARLEVAPPAPRAALELVPPSEGAIPAAELRRALADGRVDAFVQPIVSLPQRRVAFVHAVPRLRAADGRHLHPSEYVTTAARCGLLALIDQILVIRCAHMVRRALAEGRRVCVFCQITPGSLNDAGFTAAVLDFLAGHREVAAQLVLEIDRVRLDLPGDQAMARLRKLGVRFCLKRLSVEGLDAAEAVRRGFEFVKLEAPRYATDPEQPQLDPALLRLHEALEAAGLTLIVDQIDSERTLVEVLDYPVAFGQGPVFAAARSGAAA